MSMAANPQPRLKKQATRPPAWKALAAHYKTISKLHLRQLFADDPDRGQCMAIEAVGRYLDYSQNRATDTPLHLPAPLAGEAGLPERLYAPLSAEAINTSETRAGVPAVLPG